MDAIKQVDEYMGTLDGWMKKNLVMFRKLMHKADANLEEAWKWDVPVFISKKKMVTAMSTFKDHTKFNFFTGAALKDSNKLFNNGLESKKHRSLDMFEGDTIDESKLLELIKEAINSIK